MSMSPALHSFAYSLDFLREQVADVAPDSMAAHSGAAVNHPMWVIGHLVATCEQLSLALGAAAWLPTDWHARYGTGSTPVADASRYESKPHALDALRDAQSRITATVQRLNDEQLDQPFPDESLLPVFPTLRHAVLHVLVAHTAYHVAQVAAWRKAMNLPRLQRVYE